MIELVPETRIDEQLFDFIVEWFDLIAQGRLADACVRLDEPNTYGMRWTPALIIRTVQDAFGIGTRFRVTHPEGPAFSAPSRMCCDPHRSVGSFADGSGYWAVHAVPLNGEWSDLSAEFEFRYRDDKLAAILHDLRVL